MLWLIGKQPRIEVQYGRLEHFPVYLEVPDVLNIKMSQSYGHFDLLGSLDRGFRAEL